MRIFVVGGSLFLGRIFTMIAKDIHDLTLLNRGNYSMKEFGVFEYKMDRHDKNSLRKIIDDYDVVVDFCAYQKEDIKTILNSLSSNIEKYIFVSTCDVYERDGDYIKDEHTPFNYNTHNYPEDIKDYIDGKVLLEEELINEGEKKNINYTSIRPSIIYGPYNYAPRESFYIQNIIQNGQAIYPKDATGEFQVVYVKDVAEAILKVCESDKISKAYNLASSYIVTYNKFAELIKSVSDVSYEELFLYYNQMCEYGIPTPFPYYKEECELYDGGKITRDFDFSYTPHEVGFQKTYHAFKAVYKR